MTTIIWTRGKIRRFEHEYDKAVKEKMDTFLFEDEEIVTSYAKYLLIFLKEQFK